MAYNLFINELTEKKISDNDTRLLENVLLDKTEYGFKQIAKTLASLSNNAVFWAFHRNNLYYTGISNLLSQPEFAQTNLVLDISEVIDRVDEIINAIFDDVKFETQIMLGADNPFGNFCSTILTKYQLGENIGLFGILGPMRMNYEKNLALVKFINNKLTKQ
jgi:heat-inducible transcriptional repressor